MGTSVCRLRAGESYLLKAYGDALLDEEYILKQVFLKVEWLRGVNGGLLKIFFGGKKASAMMRPVTLSEVKEAMFRIGDNKSPGPDRFTCTFFKESCGIVLK
ncbi:hypothetical protein Tco_0006523 [Tanacetum coccineum]